MRPTNDYRRFDGNFYYPKGHDNTGIRDKALAEEDARVGSTMLREAIDKAVWKFAWRYKIEQNEASHLLLNTGVRLPEKLAA